MTTSCYLTGKDTSGISIGIRTENYSIEFCAHDKDNVICVPITSVEQLEQLTSILPLLIERLKILEGMSLSKTAYREELKKPGISKR